MDTSTSTISDKQIIIDDGVKTLCSESLLSNDKYYELNPLLFSSGAMTCYHCKYSIVTEHHKESCHTVIMDTDETINLDETPKPIMTFGLGGYTACCIYNKTKNTITMAHYTLNIILDIINQHSKDDISVYIKRPGEYVKQEDGKWIMEGTTQISFKPNISVTESFYSLISTPSKFNFYTSLYVKYEDDKVLYTDEYGCWKSL